MNIAIITTSDDPSAVSLVDAGARLYRYDNMANNIASLDTSADAVYFRDPFNDGRFDAEAVQSVIDGVRAAMPHAYYIDAIAALEDAMFEDKWRQYERLSAFMPLTHLLRDIHDVVPGRTMAKQRLSSRAKGIVFDPSQVDMLHMAEGYIVQPLLDIAREWRVLAVGGKQLPLAARRSSKTPDGQKVKLLSVESLPDNAMEFVRDVLAAAPPYDLCGLDIVELISGQMALIEVNRSPQFASYERLSGESVSQLLYKHLLTKI